MFCLDVKEVVTILTGELKMDGWGSRHEVKNSVCMADFCHDSNWIPQIWSKSDNFHVTTFTYIHMQTFWHVCWFSMLYICSIKNMPYVTYYHKQFKWQSCDSPVCQSCSDCFTAFLQVDSSQQSMYNMNIFVCMIIWISVEILIEHKVSHFTLS